MQLRLLGPLDVYNSNGRVSMPSGKPRSLLVLLALHPNEPVSSDRIVDALWGDAPPGSATAIVQTYVSRLRKVLGEGCIETVGHGYRLVLPPGARDIDLVERLRERSDTEAPAEAALSLREALGLFNGQPLADVAHEEFAQAELRRLEELRAALVVQRIEADVEAGKHADVLAELESLVADRPLDERLRGLLILALYRSGRQADALAAYQDARRTLNDDLGLEPSEELRSLQRKILEHDPSLDGPSAERPPYVVDMPAPMQRPRVLAVVVGLVAALVAAVVAGVLALRDRSTTPLSVPPNSVAVIDPKTLETVASVPVGRRPAFVTSTLDFVWVASTGDKVVTQIDPRTFEVTATAGLGFEPTDIQAVGDSVWVAGGYDHALWRIDRDALVRVKLTFHERHPLPPGFERGPAGLAWSKDGLWLTHGGEVTLLDPVTGKAKKDIEIGGLWSPAISVGTTALVGSSLGVETFNPRTWKVGPTVSPLFGTPTRRIIGDARFVAGLLDLPAMNRDRQYWIAWRPGQLWNVWDPADAEFFTLVGTVDLHYEIAGMAYADDAVWVTTQRELDELANSGSVPLVHRIDPTTGQVEATIELDHTPEGIAVAKRLLWVAVRDP